MDPSSIRGTISQNRIAQAGMKKVPTTPCTPNAKTLRVLVGCRSYLFHGMNDHNAVLLIQGILTDAAIRPPLRPSEAMQTEGCQRPTEGRFGHNSGPMVGEWSPAGLQTAA